MFSCQPGAVIDPILHGFHQNRYQQTAHYVSQPPQQNFENLARSIHNAGPSHRIIVTTNLATLMRIIYGLGETLTRINDRRNVKSPALLLRENSTFKYDGFSRSLQHFVQLMSWRFKSQGFSWATI